MVRLLIIVLVAGALPILVAWLVVAQPIWVKRASKGRTITIDPLTLEKHVRMLAETLAPRDYHSVQNLDRVADYIRAEFQRASPDVSDQLVPFAGNTYRNVMALVGPRTTQRIVVGAHYDVAGPLPGADDNASGVAGLIELAHTLSKEDLGMQVELVAFTLEEPPTFATPDMGSAVHARALRDAGIPVRMMISLEMIGYYTDAPFSQNYPVNILRFMYPTKGNFLAVVGRTDQRRAILDMKKPMVAATALPIRSIAAPALLPGIAFSDHRNYWAAGYPAVMVTDTAFYRNDAYHSAEDTADRLDYRRMTQAVEAVAAAVVALSHDPT